MTPNNSFEDKLLVELRRSVALRTAPAASSPPRRRHARRLLPAGVTVAAAAATAVVVFGGGDPTSQAYAVEKQPDGDVNVTVNSLSDADGLERKLNAAGVDAVVDYVPAGKACAQPRGQLPALREGEDLDIRERADMSIRVESGGRATFTISRGLIKSDQTLVLSGNFGQSASLLSVQIVEGTVASCSLVDAPEQPPRGTAPGSPTPPVGGKSTGGKSIGVN